MNCGNCNKTLGAFVRCHKCNVQLHSTCVHWEDAEDSKIVVCNKCKKVPIVLPIEYDPGEASTSHVQSTEVNYGGLHRELTCILFPGIVKNVDKAIQCLGGVKGISQVLFQPQKRRLGLSFQPENPYVKKTYADYSKTAGVLLKIKVKKIKEDGEVKRKVISTNFVGRVNKIHRFDSMCDFQFLPVYREASGEPLQCLLDKIIPSQGEDFSFIGQESPLFIVPLHFTRSDKPINYMYTEKKYLDSSNKQERDDDVHNKLRSERSRPLEHWWNFSYTGDLPVKPDESYLKARDARCYSNAMLIKEYNTVHTLFQERPIWSFNFIRYETKLRMASLKVIIPCLAVFMKSGPWKSLWVRYGYDPRKEPSARAYQTLDFRLRHAAGVYCMVMTRDQIAHYKSADRVRVTKRKHPTPLPPSEDISEGAVLFRPGMVPAQRQIFYQLCDIKLPEVESIIAAEPARECHMRYGWLPPNAIDTIRDILFQTVKDTLLATHNADLKFDVAEDGGSSDEDSGDEITNNMDETM